MTLLRVGAREELRLVGEGECEEEAVDCASAYMMMTTEFNTDSCKWAADRERGRAVGRNRSTPVRIVGRALPLLWSLPPQTYDSPLHHFFFVSFRSFFD